MKKSAKYYKKNKASYAKKRAYDKKFGAKPEQIKKRSEANQARRKAKKAGKDIRGKEYDHAVKRFVDKYTNRSRNEKSRVKGFKQNNK